MCGFVALFNADRTPAEASLLTHMADALAHRGPDDEGTLTEGPFGCAHRRLAIIDPLGGRQPMTVGPATVVFNGMIYNYPEIRRELESAGQVFQTDSDTEVLLRAYLAYGPGCVRRFNGMFAFVLYDRALRRLMAARDHFGIKPLYLWKDGRRWLFGSEIKALLRHPAVRPEPNPEALRDYAVFQYVLDENTFFRGVRKVCPGHYLIIDTGTLAETAVRYWEPDYSVDGRTGEEDFAAALRSLLDDAVRLQVRSDVPLGVTVSGGLDSAIVAALASRHAGRPLQAYTGVFREGPDFDESDHARRVAGGCGAVLHEVTPAPSDFVEHMPNLVRMMDEPMAGPGLFPQYLVARRAAQDVKVILGGQGGDEIFGGYARYVIAYLEQALKGAVYETNDEGEHIVSLRSILPNLPYLRRYVPMLRRFWEEGVFDPMDRRYFRLIDRSGGDFSAFSPDFRAGLDMEHILGRFQKVFSHPQTLSYYNKLVHFDLVVSLPALLHVEDRMTSACSIESRVPLLDRRIVDLIASMPPRMKFKGAEMKYILKKAAGDLVPPSVLARKDKMGFPVPLHVWAGGQIRDFFADILLSTAARQRGMYDPVRIEALLGSEDPYGRKLWGLLNMELWFRTFIDSRGGAPPRETQP